MDKDWKGLIKIKGGHIRLGDPSLKIMSRKSNPNIYLTEIVDIELSKLLDLFEEAEQRGYERAVKELDVFIGTNTLHDPDSKEYCKALEKAVKEFIESKLKKEGDEK